MVMMMMTLHVFTETDHSTTSLKKNKKVKKILLHFRCQPGVDPGGDLIKCKCCCAFFLAEKQYAVWEKWARRPSDVALSTVGVRNTKQYSFFFPFFF